MTPKATPDARTRLDDLVRRWGVDADTTVETESSLIVYGRCGVRPVVLKVVRRPGDEWRSGGVVRAFGGRGMVSVLEHDDGALLVERLDPGTQLAEVALSGRDDEATSFARYRESGEVQIDPELVVHAERVHLDLCVSQTTTRLLHGDLQHYNVLYDRDRGWVAIDPKGVIGEVEYELGASMRNPVERPSMFTDGRVVRRRLERLCSALGLDFERALAWTFAQAVLSAIWSVEDGHSIDASAPVLMLARAIRG